MAKFNLICGIVLSVGCLFLIVLICLQAKYFNPKFYVIGEMNEMRLALILASILLIICGTLAYLSFHAYKEKKK